MSDTPRGAAGNYQLMSNEDIKKIPINCIADPEGAILAMWVPSSLLQEGLDVMNAWGFNQKQTYIWVKTKKIPHITFSKYLTKNFIKKLPSIYSLDTYKKTINSIQDSLKDINMNDVLSFGMGRLFRQCHEICLIGTNNNKIYKNLFNKSQRSVSFAENLRHSTKPENLQDSLELMFPGEANRIELFARRQRKGWFCLGNDSPMAKGEDIFESIKKLTLISDPDVQSIKSIINTYDVTKSQQLFDNWNNIK